MQPPTGGTILTAASTGTPSTPEERPPATTDIKIDNSTYTENLTGSEVSFSDNVDFDAAVARNNTVIAAYATRRDRSDFPFWPMLFDNMTIRLIGSDDFPAAAKQQAARGLTAAAHQGALSTSIGTPLPLERTAEAHDLVDAGSRQRVLVAIGD